MGWEVQVNFHNKESIDTVVRTVKSGGTELVVLRVMADGNMVDLFFRDPDDAYTMLGAVNEVLDLFEGEPAP